MAGGFSVLDLIDLPLLSRQIVCQLLRRPAMTASELSGRVAFPQAQVSDALRDLIALQWLTSDRDGDRELYRIRLSHRPRRSNDFWTQIGLETIGDTLGKIDPGLHSAPRSNNHRGGKRHLPANIWERLDEPVNGPTEDTLRPARWRGEQSRELLGRLTDAPAEPPPRPAATGPLRQALWDALDDEKH